MKKIVIMILPLFMIIAIIFYIKQRDFNINVFLEFISNLRFNNAYDQLVSTRDLWGEMINTFDSLYKPKNPFDIIDNLATIGDGIIYLYRIGLSFGMTIFKFIAEIIDNILDIFTWLFIS